MNPVMTTESNESMVVSSSTSGSMVTSTSTTCCRGPVAGTQRSWKRWSVTGELNVSFIS